MKKEYLRNIKPGQYVVNGGEVLRRGETRWACYRLYGGNSVRLNGAKTYPVFTILAEAEQLAAQNRIESEKRNSEAIAKHEARIKHRRELFEAAGGWPAAEKWLSENPTAIGNVLLGSEGYKKRVYSRFCDSLEKNEVAR